MSQRKWAVVVGAILVTLGVGMATWRALASTGEASFVIGDSVASDFAAVAQDTYAEFERYAAALGDCVSGMRLEAVYELEELALYDQDTGVLQVRVPAPETSLRASLVHEFAHHVEVACPSHEALRSRFLAAQGTDPATGWFDGDTWDDIPSEQFAEAVVEVVLGVRMRHRLSLQLDPEAVDAVADWLATGT